jgi:hypothetical protein
MERRRFLRAAGGVTAVAAAAGCITVSNDGTQTAANGSNGDVGSTATDDPSPTSGTPSGSPTPVTDYGIVSDRVRRDGPLVSIEGVLENPGDEWASVRVWFDVLGSEGSRVDRIGTIVPRIEGGTRTEFTTRPYDQRVGPDFEGYSLETATYSRPVRKEDAGVQRFSVQRDGDDVWLTGTVDNMTGGELDLRVWAALYDADGLRIGLVIDDVDGVAGRGRAEFETARFTEPSNAAVDSVSLLAEPH